MLDMQAGASQDGLLQGGHCKILQLQGLRAPTSGQDTRQGPLRGGGRRVLLLRLPALQKGH